MKPSLYLVKSLIMAEEGDYILVINDEVISVVSTPKKIKPEIVSKETTSESILDSIINVIRSKGYCTTRFIGDKLGIARNDQTRRSEITAHVKHLLVTGRIRKCANASRLGPYEVVE